MVYIYKKITGGKPYYYLRASERKGKKIVVKDIAYLGNSLENVRRSLQNLSQYKTQIRKAYKTIHHFLESNTWLEKAKILKLRKDDLLGEKIVEIQACRLHFNQVFKKLPSETKSEAFRNFVIEFAFNTTSIEGNTITLQQARALLEE